MDRFPRGRPVFIVEAGVVASVIFSDEVRCGGTVSYLRSVIDDKRTALLIIEVESVISEASLLSLI